jgi:SAM-dependent methyltransferase
VSKAVTRKKKQPQVCLNLGCGVGLLSGFINVDAFFTREQLEEGFRTKQGFCANAWIEPGAEYVQADILELHHRFPGHFADYVLLDNVIEHFPIKLVDRALAQIYRVMKPGATLVVVTPDFNCLASVWADHIASKVGTIKDFRLYEYIQEVVYGNQVGAGEYHRVAMTPDYLHYKLKIAGFIDTKVHVYPMGQPGPKNGTWKGVEMLPNATMRTDNIFAETRKPNEKEATEIRKQEEKDGVPPPLGINVAEVVKVTSKGPGER